MSELFTDRGYSIWNVATDGIIQQRGYTLFPEINSHFVSVSSGGDVNRKFPGVFAARKFPIHTGIRKFPLS